MKKWIEIATVAASIGVIAFLGWLVFFEPRIKNQPSKEALTRLHENLRLGDSQERVVELYSQFQTDRTRLQKEFAANVWEIGMPVEFGSGDWILYLEFDDAERLGAAVFRSSDGIFHKPRDSPEDKGEFAFAISERKRD